MAFICLISKTKSTSLVLMLRQHQEEPESPGAGGRGALAGEPGGSGARPVRGGPPHLLGWSLGSRPGRVFSPQSQAGV